MKTNSMQEVYARMGELVQEVRQQHVDGQGSQWDEQDGKWSVEVIGPKERDQRLELRDNIDHIIATMQTALIQALKGTPDPLVIRKAINDAKYTAPFLDHLMGILK